MCYNCGCGMPNNDMGHAENIILSDFQHAAEAMGQPADEALRNARDLIDKTLAAGEWQSDTKWKPA